MASGNASKRGFDPSTNGAAAYRYLLVSAHLQCEDSAPDDSAYQSHAMRLRRIAQPSIERHLAKWQLLREGYMQGEPTKKACSHCAGRGWKLQDPEFVPGFWTDEHNQLYKPGDLVPKDAYIGMEGGVIQILHSDGLLWFKKRKKNDMRQKYSAKAEAKAAEMAADEEE